ncbi:MAG TPA: LysR family transcriptional regulator [Myxococcota bacterium]|nr:LysR family transcriptional regulator [Myxococcota bacterium]
MQRAIDPNLMILFSRVVDAGSFTAAARALGLTKQTVSERVLRLEEALGARLLERTTRSLRPTDLGARYHAECRALAAQIDEANRLVDADLSHPSGRVRVSLPVVFGRHFLAPALAGYCERFPEVTVEVSLADRHVDLVAEGFDLAIRVGEVRGQGLVVRRLGEGHVHYVASPGFVANNPRLRFADLPKMPTIGMQATETWSFRGRTLEVEPKVVVNELEVVCELAVSGLGVGRVPDLVHGPLTDRGELVLLFGGAIAFTRPIHVVLPSRRFLPLKVSALVDALTEHPPGGRRSR